MVKIKWSLQSVEDLENIYEYISKDSPNYAKIFILKIMKIISEIPEHPRIGRIVPEFNEKNLRERIFKSFRIVYRIKNKKIEIVTIIHSTRTLKVKESS